MPDHRRVDEFDGLAASTDLHGLKLIRQPRVLAGEPPGGQRGDDSVYDVVAIIAAQPAGVAGRVDERRDGVVVARTRLV